MRAASSQGKTLLPQMGTDETQIGRRGTLGGARNHFNREPREPRENVLTQRRKGAKLGNSIHGWIWINADFLTRYPQIQRRWTNLKPRTAPNPRTQIPNRIDSNQTASTDSQHRRQPAKQGTRKTRPSNSNALDGHCSTANGQAKQCGVMRMDRFCKDFCVSGQI